MLGSSISMSGGGGGSGDMLKTDYDTNDDGVVNAADVAGVANGTTFPATPATGDMFLHTPTGRKILYQYDGTTWRGLMRYGSATVYVDKTDGTDDLEHGYGVDAAAFKTIQYAIDNIPQGLSTSNNCVIYINNETYIEDLTFRGKRSDRYGGYYLYGTLNINGTALTATGGAQGAGSTPPQVNGTFSANAYNRKLIKFTSGANNGLYRVISKTTTTTLWLNGGPLTAQPVNGDTYEIYDWGTTIQGVTDFSISPAIFAIYDIKFTDNAAGYYTFVDWGYTYIKAYRCWFQSTQSYSALYVGQSSGEYFDCLVTAESSGSTGIKVMQCSSPEFNGVKVYGTHNNGTGVDFFNATASTFRYGSEIDGFATGLSISQSSSCLNDHAQITYIHGCTTGIKLSGNSELTGTSYFAYTDIDGTADANTTNFSRSAISLGNVTATNLTDSGLTSGQIPVAGTAGLLGNGPKWSTAKENSVAKITGSANHSVSGASTFYVQLVCDTATYDLGTNTVTGDLHGQTGAYLQATGASDATHIVMATPTFDTSILGGALYWAKWASNAAGDADTGEGWVTCNSTTQLTITYKVAGGTDFADDRYFWIRKGYYVAPVAGYYQINVQGVVGDAEDGKRFGVGYVINNGTQHTIGGAWASAAGITRMSGADIVHLDANDKVKLMIYFYDSTAGASYPLGAACWLTANCIKLD